MSTRELILLSPYRLPAQHSGMFDDGEVAAWLNGYLALWHPAAAAGAGGPPRIGSPYDYEEPQAGHLYAVPENPPLVLPDDWEDRVRRVGAALFHATADRGQTLANLHEALRTLPPLEPTDPPLPTLDSLVAKPEDRVRPFQGIGFGFLHVEGLFEAMEHENLLASGELWDEVRQAVAALDNVESDDFRQHLQVAADRLREGREVLYPSSMYVVDLAILSEDRLGEPLPAAFDRGMPLNLMATGRLLEKLRDQNPNRLTAIAERIPNDLVELCGGMYLELEDALLPVESQLWNLHRGVTGAEALLGRELRVHARKRFGAHPQTPLFLQHFGVQRAILVPFDDAVMPNYRSTVINLPSPDGKQVEAFVRAPYRADSPQTFFHIAHYLHRSIMQDQGATIALLHDGHPAAPWYEDWLELSRFGPVLGQWVTLSQYTNEVMPGEYASAPTPDEFHGDYLSERLTQHPERPVSWFARHARQRRRLDTAWTLAAFLRGLGGAGDMAAVEAKLNALEERLETGRPPFAEESDPGGDILAVQTEVAEGLAGRLLSRAASDSPGFLVLNPCSFTRRLALELDGVASPIPVAGPVKACQMHEERACLVVEVPPLGFAWFPEGSGNTTAAGGRMKLADGNMVRNEFLEAEVDPQSGGLKAIRDHRTRVNRLGQQLVFNPGSTMKAREVRVTSSGPAFGEIITEGGILDEQENVLATFRQRIRAWLGRPVLDLRIEIFPERRPEGYPWHAYYATRFAWRDERATLLRGVNGSGSVTSHTRPETPDYLELRLGRHNTVIFPGGLPFHQRHSGRMLDVILIPEGEKATAFDMAIGMDREQPMQTALGMITPTPVVRTTKGPPHVGATGWLYHLDAPNLLLTTMRPAPNGEDAIVARLLECAGYGGPADFRFVRDPREASLEDGLGHPLMGASTEGDTVHLEVAAGDLVQLRVSF